MENQNIEHEENQHIEHEENQNIEHGENQHIEHEENQNIEPPKPTKNTFANLALTFGLISIGTDLLTAAMGGVNLLGGVFIFWVLSTILELLAIGFGITGLALKQNSSRSWNGIIMGLIGIGFTIWAFM